MSVSLGSQTFCKFCGKGENLFKISLERNDSDFYFMCENCFLGVKQCYSCTSTHFYNSLKCQDCNLLSCNKYQDLVFKFNSLVNHLKNCEIATEDFMIK